MSRAHDFSFRGAIYLPMVAGMLAYTRLAPVEYEGKPYLAINCGGEITSIGGLTAAAWVIAYLAWTLWRDHSERAIAASQKVGLVHPGEWWGGLVAFSSGYALGASNASFLLVLAVHHEVQYLYFTLQSVTELVRLAQEFGIQPIR
jgi:hypothetical protein